MISTLSAFLERIDDGSDAAHLYRGQANEQWQVDCSAVRRLNEGLCGEVKQSLLGHVLTGYLIGLLRESRQYVGNCPELPLGSSDLDILAQLQHQGAATGLIDFTLDPLVALWFACSGYSADDGAVYVLAKSDTKEVESMELPQAGGATFFRNLDTRGLDDPPYVWKPKESGRPTVQQSVFVLGVPFVWPALLQKIVIRKDAKPGLLEELKSEHGITESRLFPDFSGYAHANAASRPVKVEDVIGPLKEITGWQESDSARVQAYLNCGLACVAVGNHSLAVDQFTRAIAMDPNNVGAYVNRAGVYFALSDYQKSLEDYDIAIEKIELGDEEYGDARSLQQVASVYWDRGGILQKLGRESEGIADCNRAIELGLKVYINPNTGEIARNPIPEEMERYKDTPS